MKSYFTPPSHHHLILASQSPRRKQLLADAGVGVQQIIAADIDETPAQAELPVPYALRMALQKAEVITAITTGQFVLAADTVVACGRRILPKAETAEQASACLDLLSGRAHRVYGRICLCLPNGDVRTRLSVSQVKFRVLDKTDKKAYLDSGEWQGKAGGYAIQGRRACISARLRAHIQILLGWICIKLPDCLWGRDLHMQMLADGLFLDCLDHPRLIAAVYDNRVIDLWAEQDSGERLGSVHLARVTGRFAQHNRLTGQLSSGASVSWPIKGKAKITEGQLVPVTLTAAARQDKPVQAVGGIELAGRLSVLRWQGEKQGQVYLSRKAGKLRSHADQITKLTQLCQHTGVLEAGFDVVIRRSALAQGQQLDEAVSALFRNEVTALLAGWSEQADKSVS